MGPVRAALLRGREERMRQNAAGLASAKRALEELQPQREAALRRAEADASRSRSAKPTTARRPSLSSGASSRPAAQAGGISVAAQPRRRAASCCDGGSAASPPRSRSSCCS